MLIEFREVRPGLLLEGDDFTLSAFPVYHRGSDSYGYIFDEKSRRPFLPEKAEVLGVPVGPWRRDLVNGQAVTLPDGRIITPDEVLGPERPGAKFVHIGDAGRTSDLIAPARGADALVIEATYLQSEAEMAREFGHLTARRSAELAQEAGVGQLLLTHISRRYRERDVLAEAREVFPNTVVARDFDAYQIRRGAFSRVDLATEGLED